MADLPPLTIRNLTTTPMELKLVERFEEHHSLESGMVRNITRGVSSLMSGQKSPPKSPTHAELASKSGSFTHQDVSIPIGPFEIKTTDIEPAGRKHRKIIRLTFESEGHKYRIDTPTTSDRSTIMTPLSPNPPAEYTAVYLRGSSYLALYSSAALSSWMSQLRDECPLSLLSIPGTHNSPTHHVALPSVRCQAVSLQEQLNNGVRFLDIRVQPESPDSPSKDGLILVHSAFPISLTGNKHFRALINEVESFLKTNPSETIIISLKREGVGKATDQQLSKIFHDHYAENNGLFYTEPRIPLLSEARGKIVMIRRFSLDDSLRGEHEGRGFCIDAESWPDNCTDGTCSSGQIRVQDFYEVSEAANIDKKITYSTDQLERAAASTCPLPNPAQSDMKAFGLAHQQPFFINFLSASNFFSPACWYVNFVS